MRRSAAEAAEPAVSATRVARAVVVRSHRGSPPCWSVEWSAGTGCAPVSASKTWTRVLDRAGGRIRAPRATAARFVGRRRHDGDEAWPSTSTWRLTSWPMNSDVDDRAATARRPRLRRQAEVLGPHAEGHRSAACAGQPARRARRRSGPPGCRCAAEARLRRGRARPARGSSPACR